jgi:NAD(P)-dependent dehydrogenase (short-subunit alcohol dehydrogenase family)
MPRRPGDHRDRSDGWPRRDRGIRYSGLAGLNRLGQSKEIASVALFLASDLASFVSGVTLNVDGGI